MESEKVKRFNDDLVDKIPTTMTVGGRMYEILDFHREDNGASVKGDVMEARAKEMDANLGEDDALHLLEHQGEIPIVLRKVLFVFTGWFQRGKPGITYYICWDGGRWVKNWRLRLAYWAGCFKVLRRK